MPPDRTKRQIRHRLAWMSGLIGAGITAAMAFAADDKPDFPANLLSDRVQSDIVAPVKILATARIEGISDTIGPVSDGLAGRLAWLQNEVGKMKNDPNLAAHVTPALIDAAYQSGARDAVRYGYGETELEQIVTRVGSMGPDLITMAFDLEGKLLGAGLSADEAARTAYKTVEAGARSSIEQSDIWIADLAAHVDAWSYGWECHGCSGLQKETAISLPFEALLKVSESLDDALLFSLNDRKDITKAFADLKAEGDLRLAEAGPGM